LSRNLIEVLPEGAFQSCPELQALDVKRNPLKNFDVNAFAHLPNLKKL
jgi:hypothetical protein